jgi:hypothetical protein
MTFTIVNPCVTNPPSFTIDAIIATQSVIDPLNTQDLTLSYTLADDYSCYANYCGALLVTPNLTAE